MRKQYKIEKGARRAAAVRSGAYDGRFGHRVFTDRKKQHERNLCRERVDIPQEEEVSSTNNEAVASATHTEEAGFSLADFL
jgi:hypothetical protein